MRCVAAVLVQEGAILVQVAVMWLQFQIRYLENGEEPQINHFCLWFPSISNLGTMHLRLDISVDVDTGAVTGKMELRSRRGLEHFWGEEPEMV